MKKRNILNEIPKWLGYKADGSVKMFLYREIIHAAFGAILAGVAEVSRVTDIEKVLRPAILGVMLLVFIITKEIKEDQKSQTRLKTYADCIAWAVGFGIGGFMWSKI